MQTSQLYKKLMRIKAIGAGIRTKNPWDMILLPQPLDQGSRQGQFFKRALFTFLIWNVDSFLERQSNIFNSARLGLFYTKASKLIELLEKDYLSKLNVHYFCFLSS